MKLLYFILGVIILISFILGIIVTIIEKRSIHVKENVSNEENVGNVSIDNDSDIVAKDNIVQSSENVVTSEKENSDCNILFDDLII